MIQVQQSFREITDRNPLKVIEQVGRICYKSEDSITPTSHTDFVRKMLTNTHTAMIEHGILHFETDNHYITEFKYYSPYAANVTLEGQEGFGTYRMSINATAFRELAELCLDMGISDELQNVLMMMIKCVHNTHPILVEDIWPRVIVEVTAAEEEFEECSMYLNLLPEFEIDDLFDAHKILTHRYHTIVFVTDRGVTHEMVRQRPPSFGQESTRYCNYSKEKFGNEITVLDIARGMELDPKVSQLSVHLKNELVNVWKDAMLNAEASYLRMIQLGATPQIARSVLPNSTKTEIGITCNAYEWFHIFYLRCAKSAHPQMQDGMIPVAQALVPLYKSMVGFDNGAEIQNPKFRKEVQVVCAMF